MPFFKADTAQWIDIFDAGTLTLASDAITLPVVPNGASMITVKVDTEAAAATDNLATINVTGPVAAGVFLIVKNVNAGRVVVVQNVGESTILLHGTESVTLRAVSDSVILVRNAAGGWTGHSFNLSGGVSARVEARAIANRNLVDDTSNQAIFATANDEFAVDAGGVYRFRLNARLTKGANSVSANTLFGGTATFTTVNYNQITGHAASGTAVAANINNCEAATACVGVAGTGVNYRIIAEGEFVVNAAGTVIPQVAFSGATGATPSVNNGTFFEIWKIGSGASLGAIGNWS